MESQTSPSGPIEENPKHEHDDDDGQPKQEHGNRPPGGFGGRWSGESEPAEALPRLLVREELPRKNSHDDGRLVEHNQIRSDHDLMYQRPRQIGPSVRSLHANS